MRFCFGLHNHQPIGNFGWVLEKVHKDCYLPLLELLWKYPRVKFSYHMTGYLLEWHQKHAPKTLTLLKRMIQRGQVEILGGGYQEPILASIPRRDREGQIEKHLDAMERQFGVRPRGFWLAERVWEQEITEDLARAGLDYALVDDRHFMVTGFAKKELYRHWVTESNGHALKIFPIDMSARSLIPFKPVEDLRMYLRQMHEEEMDAVFYFDDGEKMGAWPGTYELIFEKGWMKEFLECLTLLSKTFLKVQTFGEVMDELPAAGLCYLSSSSYAEMEDWALPAQAFEEIQFYRSQTEKEAATPSPYVRGTVWKNFLIKYPESNRMHKAMLEASEAIEARRSKLSAPVRRRLIEALYATQCNDAYWHGLFGGLYLAHLRTAIWERICEIKAHFNKGKVPAAKIKDPRWDGIKRAVFDSPAVSAEWDLHSGGLLTQCLFLKRRVNLLNTLAKRREGYHPTLKLRIEQLNRGEALPHLEGVLKTFSMGSTRNVASLFKYDRYERNAFIDHFFSRADLTEREFKNAHALSLNPKEDSRFRIKGKVLEVQYREDPYQVRKRIQFLPKKGFRVEYLIRGSARRRTDVSAFGTEINFYLPVNELVSEEPDAIHFKDGYTQTQLKIRVPEASDIWHYPITMPHLTEGGCETSSQGTCVFPFWKLDLRRGQSAHFVAEFLIQ